MTQFVLHGGITSEACVSNQEFFQLMADAVPEDGLWLVCNFARETFEVQREIFERDLLQLKQALGEKKIRAELATAETLSDLLPQCDVFYMTGGSMQRLQQNLLAACPNIADKIMQVPMVGGSSAGTCVLCRDYINEDGSIDKGLGLIPYGAVVHYRAPEGFEYQNDLSNRTAPLLMLHERQFVVIEQEVA